MASVCGSGREHAFPNPSFLWQSWVRLAMRESLKEAAMHWSFQTTMCTVAREELLLLRVDSTVKSLLLVSTSTCKRLPTPKETAKGLLTMIHLLPQSYCSSVCTAALPFWRRMLLNRKAHTADYCKHDTTITVIWTTLCQRGGLRTNNYCYK